MVKIDGVIFWIGGICGTPKENCRGFSGGKRRGVLLPLARWKIQHDKPLSLRRTAEPTAKNAKPVHTITTNVQGMGPSTRSTPTAIDEEGRGPGREEEDEDLGRRTSAKLGRRITGDS